MHYLDLVLLDSDDQPGVPVHQGVLGEIVE